MTTILLDATALPKQPVGAGVYITNLIREILQFPSDLNILVLAHRDDFSLFRLSDEFLDHFIFLPDFGRVLRIVLEQLHYPWLIKKNHVDIFHGLHYSFPLWTSASTIVTIHDLSFFTHPQKHTWLKRKYFPFFIHSAVKNASRILTVSENTCSDLMKFTQCSRQKIVVTPLGVDEKFFAVASTESMDAVRKQYNLPERFILFVGLIEPRKSIPILLRAYLQLMDDLGEDIHLVVAGRWGWESKSILEEFSSHPYFSKIHFPGYISADNLPTLYQMALFFVYPSFYEGFGLPVLEAMASGLAVITTNVSAMPEIVDGVGLLVDADNPSALLEAMTLIINDPDLRLDLGRQAKDRAFEFRWELTARKTIAAYQNLIDTQGIK